MRAECFPVLSAVCEIDKEEGRTASLFTALQANIQVQKDFPDLAQAAHAGSSRDLWEMAFRWRSQKAKRCFYGRRHRCTANACRRQRSSCMHVTMAVPATATRLFLDKRICQKTVTLYIATEDGTAGTKGNVMDAIRENASGGRCDLCLRTKAYASCNQGLCSRKRHSLLYLHGRAHGMRNRCLSGLRMPVQRSG